jgi:hypothetical protein
MALRFVRLAEARDRLGLGRSTLYRLIKTGELGPLVKLIPGGDPRSSRQGRRFRDLCHEFEDDLGGADALSSAERAIVKQAAAATVQVEAMAAAIVRGEPVNEEQFTRLNNVASRLLRTLIGKRSKRKPPSRLARILTGEE